MNENEGEEEAELWYSAEIEKEKSDSKLIAKTFLDLIEKYKMKDVYDMKKPLFCSFLVENIITPFLPCDRDFFKLLGSTDESDGSKLRKNGKGGRIPDLSLSVEYKYHSSLPFICKVKSWRASSDAFKAPRSFLRLAGFFGGYFLRYGSSKIN